MDNGPLEGRKCLVSYFLTVISKKKKNHDGLLNQCLKDNGGMCLFLVMYGGFLFQLKMKGKKPSITFSSKGSTHSLLPQISLPGIHYTYFSPSHREGNAMLSKPSLPSGVEVTVLMIIPLEGLTARVKVFPAVKVTDRVT